MTGGGTGAEGKTRKERVLAEGSERDLRADRWRGPEIRRCQYSRCIHTAAAEELLKFELVERGLARDDEDAEGQIEVAKHNPQDKLELRGEGALFLSTRYWHDYCRTVHRIRAWKETERERAQTQLAARVHDAVDGALGVKEED